MPANEHLTMQIAKQIYGIDTASNYENWIGFYFEKWNSGFIEILGTNKFIQRLL